MTRTSKTDLPQHSLLHSYIQQGDFLDCYKCPTTLPVDDAAQRAMAFPSWAKGLLRLRNILVAPLGLKNDFPEGEKIGPFPIDQRNENEVILGLDDSHLNFRISIFCPGIVISGVASFKDFFSVNIRCRSPVLSSAIFRPNVKLSPLRLRSDSGSTATQKDNFSWGRV